MSDEHPGVALAGLYRQAGGGTVHYDPERYRDLLIRAGVLSATDHEHAAPLHSLHQPLVLQQPHGLLHRVARHA